MSNSTEEAGHFSLEELLERASGTRGLDRLDWRDPIVAKGAPAIDAIKPWLCDPNLGWFASVVIRAIGQTGHRDSALAALRDGVGCATDWVRKAIREAASALGETIDVPTPFDGMQLAPSYTDPSVFHVLVDRLTASGTEWGDIYLTTCGWAYSGEYLRGLGGPVAHQGQTICGHCARAMERRT